MKNFSIFSLNFKKHPLNDLNPLVFYQIFTKFSRNLIILNRAHFEKIVLLVEFKYFYSFCFNGCLGFIRTWLENGENMPPEYAARLTFQMVVSSLDAFYEDAKENK